MSGLVGYGSSDDDEVDDVQPEKPAKKAKLEHDTSLQQANEIIGAETQIASQVEIQKPAQAPYAPVTEPAAASTEVQGPAPGPSAPPSTNPIDGPASTPSEPPPSPYTSERLRLRELTMPPIPNFDIPDAPPPPPTNSEEAAQLAATTKKFERFLELRKQGVHFNERLQKSASLRNPSLLPKLMEFAGISREDSYASTLSEEVGGVPVKWSEDCHVEGLMRMNEKRNKRAAGDKMEFVAASASKSGASSARSTPGGGRKSKFDQR